VSVPAQDPPAPPPGRHRARTAARALGLVAAIAALVLFGRAAGGHVAAFAERLAALGAWGPVAFAAAYAVACVVGVPASLMTLAAGALFGLAVGTAAAFAGALLGATLAFLVSRYVARALVERRVARDARFAALDRAVGAQGRRLVFLLRLSPVFPFVLLNYALGLTRVRLRDYVVASAGMLPGTLLYVYYGKLAGDVAAAAGGAAPPRGPAYYALLALGLVATVVVTTLVARIARRALGTAVAPAPAGEPARPAVDL
jgi:uncharacterized membrane protein YdjX (TVP38/TMEM64 family)